MSKDPYVDFAESHKNKLICGKLEHRRAFPDCAKCAAKIAAIAAAFDTDAKQSHIKKERDPSLHKRIKEIDAEQSFAGETSPYWQHLFENQASSGEDGHVREDALSNPDVLSDEKDIYNRPLSPEGEIQMQAIHEAMADCTPQQQKILTLALTGAWSEKEGQRVYTEQAIADELGVGRTTVQDALIRLRKKIKRRYEMLKAERR